MHYSHGGLAKELQDPPATWEALAFDIVEK